MPDAVSADAVRSAPSAVPELRVMTRAAARAAIIERA
jgi:hypothetical protein